VKQLTVAKIRELARALELPLDEDELTRLRPMVEDLLAVARRLRSYQVGPVHEDPKVGPASSPG
jgi:hypothetical protein